MNKKKQLKNLVTGSYNGELLDGETIAMIADHMNRQTLKQYINALKQTEKKKQVMITSPKALKAAEMKSVADLFPGKKIIYVLDPEMINGIQITDNDREYELNLNKTFHDIIDHLSRYD